MGSLHGHGGPSEPMKRRIGRAAVEGANPNREHLVELVLVRRRFERHLEGLVVPHQDHDSLALGIDVVPGRPGRIQSQLRLEYF